MRATSLADIGGFFRDCGEECSRREVNLYLVYGIKEKTDNFLTIS